MIADPARGSRPPSPVPGRRRAKEAPGPAGTSAPGGRRRARPLAARHPGRGGGGGGGGRPPVRPPGGDSSPPGLASRGPAPGRPKGSSPFPGAAAEAPTGGGRSAGAPAPPETDGSRRGTANPPHLPCHNRRHLPQTLAKTPTLARAPPFPGPERACAGP